MKWKIPPKIKVHEALGCIGDGRIEVNGNEARVFSSSKGKFYSVKYDGKNAIMCNDNGSYWVGYLGYPAIAFLMLKGKIHYNAKLVEAFKDIAWKDVNVKFKNDYEKTESYVLDLIRKNGFNLSEINSEIDSIYEQIKMLEMDLFGEKVKPPLGY
ncbi:MAG: hypothetical protein ABH864_04910 [archaeon]